MIPDPLETIADGFWRMVAAALGVVVLALALFGGVQTVRLSWLQTETATHDSDMNTALSAMVSQEAMLTAMTAQRDGLLLERAANKEFTEAQLREAVEYVALLSRGLSQATQRIREMAKRPTCQRVMDMAVCPEIEKELRAP